MRPTTSPGVMNVCFLPAFAPSGKKVELISTSGHSRFKIRYWKALFNATGRAITRDRPPRRIEQCLPISDFETAVARGRDQLDLLSRWRERRQETDIHHAGACGGTHSSL